MPKLNRISRITVQVALGWFALVAASGGYAAELEEIVVTAQKRVQSANDVGITISVFTGEQLQDLGVITAEDMALFTPGLTVNDTSSTGVPLYSIRGVGFQDYSTGASSTVGLYFDEVNIPYTVMSRGAVFDIERTEVLKGPQGDLYGRNTTAGQINFISKKPTDEFEAAIKLGYGSFQAIDVEGFVSGSLGSKVQGRVAFKTSQHKKGWQESLTRPGDLLGEKDITSGRALLNIDINDDATALLRLHYVKDKSDNRASTAFNGLDEGLGSATNVHRGLTEHTDQRGVVAITELTSTPPWFSTGNPKAADWTNEYERADGTVFNLRPRRNNELVGLSAKLDWVIGKVNLSYIAAYDDFSRTEANDWDGGAFNDSSNINTTNVKVFSQELRVSGETNKLAWLGGVYYAKDKLDEFYHYFFSDSRFALGAADFELGGAPFAAFPIRELDTKYDQETESVAVFGHLEWLFLDRWKLTAGARFTDEKRTWSGCTFVSDDGSLAAFLNAAFGSSLEAGDCGTINDDPTSPTAFSNVAGTADINNAFQTLTDTLNTQRVMGKLGIDYQLDNALLYATFSQGFKSGGFNGANTNTTQQIGPYEEEVLTAYEIGMKNTLLNRRMQLNVNLFYYDYKNKQEQDLAVTFVGNISGITNIPKSRIFGVELDLSLVATDKLEFYLRAAYLDTKIREWQITTNDSFFCTTLDAGRCAMDGSIIGPNIITADASGGDLPQAPEWSLNGLASYKWLERDNWYSSIAFDVNYKGATRGVLNQPENATAAYTIFNARVSLGDQKERWKAQFWIRNITNKYYYPSAFRGGNATFVRVNGLSRTVGLNVQFNF